MQRTRLNSFLLSALLMLSASAFANCPEYLEPQSSIDLAQVEQEFAEFSENFDDGIGMRGFMGSQIPNTPETGEIALKYGVMWWGFRFVLVPTIEEAVAHRLKQRAFHEQKGTPFTDVIVAPVYILGSESELGLSFDSENPDKILVPAPKIIELLSRGAYEVDYLGQVKAISAERLLKRLNPNEIYYSPTGHLPGSFGVNSLSQAGWVALKEHGIHDYNQWKNSGSAKRLRKKATQLVEQGYSIRFNFDHEAAMIKLRDQERTYSVQNENGAGKVRKVQGQIYNRYDNKELFDSALRKLNAGKGYSIGVYNEKNELVGGEIGFRIGNHVYGDSVFYTEDIDFAKIAALALMDHFATKGMPYTDPGMVTPYTATMGGDSIPFKEYLEKMKSAPKELIEFPSNWDPRTPEMIEKTFGDIARRRSQGIGNLLAVTRWPVNLTGFAEVAARLGVEAKTLEVKIVNDSSEASRDAAQYSRSEDIPLYLVVSAEVEVGASQNLADVLNRARDAGIDWQVLQIKNPRFSEHVVKVDKKRFLDLLSLEREQDSLKIVDRVIKIPVWAVK